MESVHLFISLGRFSSFQDIRRFVEETYNEDGEATDSEFGSEVELSDYEPGCIECFASEDGDAVDAKELLKLAHGSHHWLGQIEDGLKADAAICVCEPNQLKHPERSSLTYLGEHKFDDRAG